MTKNAPDDGNPDSSEGSADGATDGSTSGAPGVDTGAGDRRDRPATGRGASPSSQRPKRPKTPIDDDLEAEGDDEADDQPGVGKQRAARPAPRRAAAPTGTPSTVMTVLATILVVAVVAGIAFLGYSYVDTRNELDRLKSDAADRAAAERVAGEFASRVSTVDYRDVPAWTAGVTKGVSPELKSKLEKASDVAGQLFQPLQWVAKGTVLDTVVTSQSGPVFKVNAYVRSEISTVQFPEGGRVQLNVWAITLDRDKDWQVTESGSDSGMLDIPPAGGTSAGASAAPTPGAPAAGN